MFDLEKQVKVIVRCDAIRWRIRTSTTVVKRIFTPILTVSEILRLETFDLENLGQGHGEQHSQWSHSTMNINVYKSPNSPFLS